MYRKRRSKTEKFSDAKHDDYYKALKTDFALEE